MALSRTTATGDGSTITYSLNFTLGYLRESDVTCQVGGEVDGLGDPVYRTLTFISPGIVTVGGDVPGVGEEIIFERTVPKDTMQNDFQADAILDEENLDDSFLQIMHAVHEFLDGRGLVVTQDLDINSNKVINVAAPTDGGDATNKTYVDSVSGAASAIAAAASAVEAAASADEAESARASTLAAADLKFDTVVTNPVDANNWVATNSNLPDAPVDGIEVTGRAIANNTGSLSIVATNGTSPWASKPCVKAGGVSHASGDIVDTYDYVWRYNSTNDEFQQIGGGLPELASDLTPQLGAPLDTNGHQVRLSKGADVATATTVTLGNDGNYFELTGTTTVTGFATKGIGTSARLKAVDVFNLTNSANLVCPGGDDITTAAGDTFDIHEFGTAQWEISNYQRAALAPTPVFSEEYRSPDQTITEGALITLSHGLSSTPKLVQGFLVNVTDEHGWVTGDILPVSLGFEATASVNDYGVSVSTGATSLTIVFGSASYVFLVHNKSTGAGIWIDPAKWNFFVRAWA